MVAFQSRDKPIKMRLNAFTALRPGDCHLTAKPAPGGKGLAADQSQNFVSILLSLINKTFLFDKFPEYMTIIVSFPDMGKFSSPTPCDKMTLAIL